MPYVEGITETLIKTLTHTGGLRTQQLAGHAANLEFWVGEVKHALDVIDGYGDPGFSLLKAREGGWPLVPPLHLVANIAGREHAEPPRFR